MKTSRPLTYVTHYFFDYTHFGIATLVESVRKYITEHVYPLFKAHYISTYHKFVAALQGKTPLSSPTGTILDKEAATLATETVLKPCINFDPTALEPDEMVSPLYWNYAGMNSLFETVLNSKEVIKVGDELLIYPQLMYIKINIDCIAVFNSYYEKLDFDIMLLQRFRGLNKLSTLYTVESFIPLPDQLLMDFPHIDWDTVLKPYHGSGQSSKLKYGLTRIVKHTGEVKPHLVFTTTPKLTLTTISDASEKYGQDRLPFFKTSFNIVVEDYVLTSLVVLPFRKTDSAISGFTGPKEDLMLLAFVLNLFKALFKRLFGLDLNEEQLTTFLLELLQVSSLGSTSSLVEFIMNALYKGDISALETLARWIKQALRNLVQRGLFPSIPIDVLDNIPLWLIVEYLKNIFEEMNTLGPRQQMLTGGGPFNTFAYEITHGVPMVLVNIGKKCLLEPIIDQFIDTVLVEVSEPVYPDSTFTIPATVWKKNTRDIFLGILNTGNEYRVDENGNIVVKGPLLPRFLLAVLVKRQT